MDGGATLKRARDASVRRGGRRGRGAAHLHERGELHGASLTNLEAGGDAGELGVAVERRGGRTRGEEVRVRSLEALRLEDVPPTAELVPAPLHHGGERRWRRHRPRAREGRARRSRTRAWTARSTSAARRASARRVVDSRGATERRVGRRALSDESSAPCRTRENSSRRGVTSAGAPQRRAPWNAVGSRATSCAHVGVGAFFFDRAVRARRGR